MSACADCTQNRAAPGQPRARYKTLDNRNGRDQIVLSVHVSVPENERGVMTDESETHVEYTPGSGNVFADLDLPDADELLAKSELVHHIVSLIWRRKLTQKDAAVLLDTTQPTVSDLERRRLDRFSLERLFFFLNRLDRDVQIVIRPKREGANPAAITVKTGTSQASPRKATAA